MMKTCTKCKVEKTLSDFYKRKDSPIGIMPACKKCHSIKAKIYNQKNGYRAQKAQMSAYQKLEFVKKRRTLKRMYAYGISSEDYEKKLLMQNGCCAICKLHESKLNKTFHIDHDHKSNSVRGILCSNCNVALGMFKD
jgi:5-methylcytosine-specific restriction endonuclease McrA